LVLPNSLVSVDGKLDAQNLDKLCIEQEGFSKVHDSWLIYSACAFGVAAKSALDKDERDRAWDLLAEGCFYLGVSNWASRGEEMTDLAFKKCLDSEFGRQGSAGRHKRTNEMKARAYELIRQEKQGRTEQDKGWPSQARAVAWLEIELKKEFGENALGNFPDTVKGWLDKMEDREQHFPTVGANRARAGKVSP
ncbi:hypothetical protein, partial [Aquabacterium sp.]|uniref:hypothetical protein n=1 Tax=Aquabacterium sp. TaxID=1872578 RepID=UPI0025BB4401